MTYRITPEVLQAVGASREDAELYAPLLDEARMVPGDNYMSITSKNGIAMLVSQLAHESMNFERTSENLNYSVKALQMDNRPKYFTQAQAMKYGRSAEHPADQRMIANLYYGGRMGNRGTHTDEGWTFRGCGLIQLTGRDNITAFGKSIGLSPEDAAEYARTPKGAVASALWYWRNRGLILPASKGDVAYCTKLINGGEYGLKDRVKHFNAALAAL